MEADEQITPETVFCALAVQVAPASASYTQERSRWLAIGAGAGVALLASQVSQLAAYLDLWWLRASVVVAVASLLVCVLQEFVSLTIPPAVQPTPATSAGLAKVGMDKIALLIDKTVPFYMRPGWNKANEGGQFHPEFLGQLLLRKHHRLREIFFSQVVLVFFAVAALAVAVIRN